MTTKSYGINLNNLADEDLIESYDAKMISKASSTFQVGNRTFLNFDANTSVRSDYSRSDYNYFRPGENIPKNIYQLIDLCNKVYDDVGIVNHVICLMADFACNGIKVVHPIKSQEKFYQRWFEKVNGKDRSERFLNMLYKSGNVVMERIDGELPVSEIKSWKSIAAKSPNIPLKYVVHSPLSLEVVGGEVASILGRPYFLLKVSSEIVQGIQAIKSGQAGLEPAITNEMLSRIPKELTEMQGRRGAYIRLNQDNLYPYHYKKDDGEVWAKPLIRPILGDIFSLAKMKLADNSALDGVISNIRLWRLGIYNQTNPSQSILPTRAGINKLRNILANIGTGGTADLVWGPELDVKELDTKTHNFLGEGKYKPTWNAIYEGLGVPPTLTGAGGSSGLTNSSLSLRTLVERLQYGRNLLIQFWNEQLRLVQKEMGFAKPAQMSFTQMSLSDDAAIKALLIQLADRDIISSEAVQESFGFVSESQFAQIKRESKKRQAKRLPARSSPFHNPNTDAEMRKIILQGGGVAPSEVGIVLEDRKKGETSQLEKQIKLKPDKKYEPPLSQNGRPPNSKDTTKRKQKIQKPHAFIDHFMWAGLAQARIAEILTPVVTSSLGKKNIRQLTNDETTSLEELKFAALCALTPYSDISEENVYNLIEETIPMWAYNSVQELKAQYIKKNHKQPTIEELRQIQSSAYALYYEEPN